MTALGFLECLESDIKSCYQKVLLNEALGVSIYRVGGRGGSARPVSTAMLGAVLNHNLNIFVPGFSTARLHGHAWGRTKLGFPSLHLLSTF